MAKNAGSELQKLRKKETKPCSDCGQEFTAYTTALRCKKCTSKVNQKNYRERKKMKKSTLREKRKAGKIDSVAKAKTFLNKSFPALQRLYYRQFSGNIGGFFNVRVNWCDSGGTIGFICHYNNYDNPNDRWEIEFDTVNGQFI